MPPAYLRKTAIALFDSLASVIPGFAQPLLAAIEATAARAQGRGYGSNSIRDEIHAILPFLPPTGAVVVDVGANSGAWSRELLASSGSRVARLIAVEPSAAHRDELERLLRHPHEHLALALGAQSGRRILYSDFLGSGLASLYPRDLSHVGLKVGQMETVSAATLDEVIAERSIGTIDLLKMDAEGSELEILRGSSNALGKRRIKALTFEFGGCNIDSRTYFRDYWSMLVPLGFVLYRIVPGGRIFQIRNSSLRDETFVTTNYLAVLERR